MHKNKTTSKDVDAYIAQYAPEVQERLQAVRHAVREIAPEAQERLTYGIPTFVLDGNLVHYAAFKNHIGFYPAPSGIEKFQEELSSYKTAKGSVQFPYDQPLPLALIKKIVRFRVEENSID